MPMILVQESGHPTRLFEVRTPSVRIGRGADCELLLTNISVSRLHATLDDVDGTSARLTPKSTKNAVRYRSVNLTGPIILEHGEQFRIGRFRLTWLHEAALDTYRLHELSEMPRFSRIQRQTHEETFAITTGMRQRLEETDALRERGALVGADGTAWRLGAGEAEIGPAATIPCASRFGRWTAARIRWAGNGHSIERIGLLARVSVNGTALAAPQVLRLDQSVTVNGTPFTYRLIPAST